MIDSLFSRKKEKNFHRIKLFILLSNKNCGGGRSLTFQDRERTQIHNIQTRINPNAIIIKPKNCLFFLFFFFFVRFYDWHVILLLCHSHWYYQQKLNHHCLSLTQSSKKYISSFSIL